MDLYEPWSITEGHHHSEACPLNVVDRDGDEVCAVVNDGALLDDPRSRCWKTARLLCASPELLRELRRLELMVRYIVEAADIDPDTTQVVIKKMPSGEQLGVITLRECLTGAAKAIAKATDAA